VSVRVDGAAAGEFYRRAGLADIDLGERRLIFFFVADGVNAHEGYSGTTGRLPIWLPPLFETTAQ
jgi:hypothetical protein